MGVSGLLQYIRAKAPQCVEPWSGPASAAPMRVAVDVPIFAHRCLFSEGSANPQRLVARFERIVDEMLAQNLVPTFVFDGGNLGLKANERRRRVQAQADSERRKQASRGDVVTTTTIPAATSPAATSTVGTKRGRSDSDDCEASADSPATPTASPAETQVCSDESDNVVPAAAAAAIPASASVSAAAAAGGVRVRIIAVVAPPLAITHVHYDAIWEALSGRHTCLRAKYEAEALCSRLAKLGTVDAVITEDSDALAYGSPLTLFRYASQNTYCIRMEPLLAALKVTLPQFQAACILMGTDFNDRLPNVGPVRAMDMARGKGVASLKTADADQSDALEIVRYLFATTCYEDLPTQEGTSPQDSVPPPVAADVVAVEAAVAVVAAASTPTTCPALTAIS